MSTTTRGALLQPAFIGGLVMGVLSALPLIGPIGNVCCCLWVVSGGAIAAYVLQQNQPLPIVPGDGAVVGLIAGLIGAAVHAVVSIPLDLMIGPLERSMAVRFIERLPPEAREVFDQYGFRDTGLSGALFVASHLIGFIFWLFVGAIVSTIGGLMGAALFRKSPPPPGTIDVPSMP